MLPRPVVLGVVGDSAAGKTTLTRGLVRVLGEENVTHVCTDDYHRYDRKQRAELGITPLHPDCNHLDIIAQHLAHLRRGEPILKPVYRHQDGTFGAPVYVRPERFTVIEGLLGYYLPEMREVFDVRVFLNPPEDLRRRWKVQRDCTRRGYTTDQVLAEIDRREADSEMYIRPQRRYADMLVSFSPSPSGSEDSQLDAELILGPELPHPDLMPFVNGGEGGVTLSDRDGDRVLRIAGRIEQEHASAIEEAIWERMHFATHLRTRRLGEFTVGTDLHRSETLALVQLLILYHLVTVKAAISRRGRGHAWRQRLSDQVPSSLLEQAAQAPVLEHLSVGLADRAVAHHVVLVEDRLEPGATARAWFAVAAVDGQWHRQLVGDRQLQRPLVVIDRVAQGGHDRVPEEIGFGLVEVRSAPERGHHRGVEDLVDPRAPDPGDHVLVTQQGVQRSGDVEKLVQGRRIGPGLGAERSDRLLLVDFGAPEQL